MARRACPLRVVLRQPPNSVAAWAPLLARVEALQAEVPQRVRAAVQQPLLAARLHRPLVAAHPARKARAEHTVCLR